jgi:aminoglycoside phosphotransferase (APT) family kinase protein
VTAWAPERLVDEYLVRELVAQFPDVRCASVRPLSEGWDRSVWLVDESLVFGFPRRAVVVAGLERELVFLPRLAPLLPLEIPVPLHVGRASERFPWPFFGSRLVRGQEAADAGLDDDARAEVGVQLAHFLRRLHGAELARAIDAEALPPDGNERANMAKRVPITRAAFAELERAGLWNGDVNTLLDDAEVLGTSDAAPTVIHGDLHFRHVIVAAGRARGVIDWIDLARGDPAVDLQLVWSFLPPAARPAFLDAYGPVTDDQLVRARVVALCLSAQLARYGAAEGHEAIAREALASLERALA